MSTARKISITGIKAREAALRGSGYVAEVVKSTLGPFGMNVMIEKGNEVTNDGYKVSKELVGALDNEFERRGAMVMQEGCAKTNDEVGDATSSYWALAQAIADESSRYLPKENSLVAKKSASQIASEIEISKNNIIEKLEVMATPIETREALIASAKVSVEDDELAEMIGGTQFDLGKDGFIHCEETAEVKSSIKRVRGIRLDNGFSSTLVVNNPEENSLEVDNLPVIITNYTVHVDDLLKLKNTIFLPIASQNREGGAAIIIIARAFSSDAIKMMMETKDAGLYIIPINAPYVDMNEKMRDMASVLGARYIDVEESELVDINLSDVGFCEKLVAKPNSAIITGQENDKTNETVVKRVEFLQKKLLGATSEFEKRNLESRIAQLTGGFAILKVGANVDVERKRLKDKCDDAVNATRLAFKGGTVPGAGLAFKTISDELEDGDILKRPIRAIYDQIMSTAPADYEVPEWVRDPFLVLKSSLKNACEAAATFSRTNAIIVSANPDRLSALIGEQSSEDEE